MKKIIHIIIAFVFSLSFTTGKAQILNPVKWDFSTNKLSDCEYELVFSAKLDKGWHLYGQKSYGDDGPIPTSFHFTKDSKYQLSGKVTESKLIKKYEAIWNVELEYFEDKAVFKQKVSIRADQAFEITGNMEYMTCNDRQCLPPATLDFSFKVEGSAGCLAKPANTTSANTGTAAVNCVCDSAAISSAYNEKKQPVQNAKNDTVQKDTATTASVVTGNNKEENEEGHTWWGIFFLGFLAGFSALLTPCVFPMIPMTVSFFTKRSQTKREGIKNASIYSFSIIAIYTSIGIIFTLVFGVDALHAMSTNVWFNLFFFAMLVIFAMSFLGAFEIVLPSRFVNKIDSQSDRGGLVGIFFMAFTLALVSFSCTSAFIGPLLFSAGATGNISGPFWGMLGFSTALALPFGLFAAFPGWLNSLPKSGGWLNSVKVTLGFLELALAFKFASNADLVVQAGILTREVFIAIWIVIFGLMGIYLLGWFKLSHDSDVKHISVPRLFFAITALSFTVYLIPGLWGAPLKLISGFPPPDFYSESPAGFGASTMQPNTAESLQTGQKIEHCPNNLPCFHDYDEALAFAKKTNKPLMIDFTGWACVNCRRMESQVWPDPEVDKRLRSEVVLVSLYVDDKTKLPADQQTVKKLGSSDFKINTIGTKWAYMQASKYQTNSQPQYILIDHNEQMLTKETAHYDPDIQKYIGWLDEGINEFKKRTGK